MHTKDNGDARGGSWSVRLGVVLLGLSLVWSLTATSAAAAETCELAIVTCQDGEQPPPTTTTTTTAPAPPPPELTSAEAAARLLSLLNDERARAGLAPFALRADVTEIAAGWSAAMARAAHLSHNDAYFTQETRSRLDARMLGENVARNSSVDGAHRALMGSPPHRANILDGRFLVIGIGAELRDGSWWVTQDFVQPATSAGAGRAGAASAPMPAPLAPATTAVSPASSAPAAPTAPDAATTPAADEDGEVLAATASEPAVATLSPSDRSEAVAASAPPATGLQAPVAALAIGLVLGALLVAATAATRRLRKLDLLPT